MLIKYPERKYGLQYAPPLTVMVNDKTVAQLREGRSARVEFLPGERLKLKVGLWINQEIPSADHNKTYFLRFDPVLSWLKLIEIPILLGCIWFINFADWNLLSLLLIFALLITSHIVIYKLISMKRPLHLIENQ